jgi:hypothetical protein
MATARIQMDPGQFGRRQSFLHGWMKIPGRPPMGCTIRNINGTGATLVFDRPACVPFSFILSIDGTNQPYGCEVRHHYGDRVGVVFVDVATISKVSPTGFAGDVGNWMRGPQVAMRG